MSDPQPDIKTFQGQRYAHDDLAVDHVLLNQWQDNQVNKDINHGEDTYTVDIADPNNQYNYYPGTDGTYNYNVQHDYNFQEDNASFASFDNQSFNNQSFGQPSMMGEDGNESMYSYYTYAPSYDGSYGATTWVNDQYETPSYMEKHLQDEKQKAEHVTRQKKLVIVAILKALSRYGCTTHRIEYLVHKVC